MINNRQAGRRRGRNNNPRQNGGGNNRGNGDSGNRIDSRARGNAAQLLEKYRNLARDAQLSGDRVNVEYYLQFADHYFRVLADNRARQEEQQQRFRRNDDAEPFGYDDADDGDDGANDDGDDVFPPLPQSSRQRPDEQQQRERRPERQERTERQERPERQERSERQERPERQERAERPERQEREPRRREERPRREPRAPRSAPENDGDVEEGLSLAALPPAIGRVEFVDEPALEEQAPAATESAPEEAPAKPRRGRKPRAAVAPATPEAAE